MIWISAANWAPKTRIETDSYIGVQLIEQKGTLDFSSLRYMAEQVEGSFTFTVLDAEDSLYIVKGDNPFCLYYFPDAAYTSMPPLKKSCVTPFSGSP